MITAKVDKETRRPTEMSARRARLQDALHPGERLVLVTESPALRRFGRLPEEYRARFVAGWDALAAALESAPPSVTVLADAYLGRTPSQGPSPRLREVMWRRPSVAMIAAMPLREEWAQHAMAVFEWGVSDVLDLNLETSPGAVWQRLRGTRARPLKRRLEAVLSGFASAYARDLVRAACETVVDGGGAAELAGLFGVEARTVSAWCRREGLPPPRRLLAWTRVMLAATLLEEDGRSVVNVARGAGYATDHALRRAMRELIGGDPATVARAKLFDQAAERFNSELRDHRERVREQRRASRPAPAAAYA